MWVRWLGCRPVPRRRPAPPTYEREPALGGGYHGCRHLVGGNPFSVIGRSPPPQRGESVFGSDVRPSASGRSRLASDGWASPKRLSTSVSCRGRSADASTSVRFPPFKIGRVIRLRKEDVDAFLEARRIQPGELSHLYPPGTGQEDEGDD